MGKRKSTGSALTPPAAGSKILSGSALLRTLISKEFGKAARESGRKAKAQVKANDKAAIQAAETKSLMMARAVDPSH